MADIIADLTKITEKGYNLVVGLFKSKDRSCSPVPEEISTAVSDLAAKQQESRERLESIATQAQDLLRSLHQKEQGLVEDWKKETELFLQGQGVDKSCIDEFIASPTTEKLNELAKKYPNIFG